MALNWHEYPFPKAEIIIVTGAPASGKSAYVQEHRRDDDLVFDLDAICSTLTGRELQHGGWPIGVRSAALAMRDSLVARALRTLPGVSRIWIIASDTRGLPNYKTIKMETSKAACLERANHRGPEYAEYVETWFREHPCG